MSEPEKKGSTWPWILVPVAAISLFFVLRECQQNLPPADPSRKHRPRRPAPDTRGRRPSCEPDAAPAPHRRRNSPLLILQLEDHAQPVPLRERHAVARGRRQAPAALRFIQRRRGPVRSNPVLLTMRASPTRPFGST